MNATRVKKKHDGREGGEPASLLFDEGVQGLSLLLPHCDFLFGKSCLPWKVYNYFNDTVALLNGTLHEKIRKTFWKVQMAILGAINSPGSKFKWKYKHLVWNRSLTYTFPCNQRLSLTSKRHFFQTIGLKNTRQSLCLGEGSNLPFKKTVQFSTYLFLMQDFTV